MLDPSRTKGLRSRREATIEHGNGREQGAEL